jgi:hypothetical protein
MDLKWILYHKPQLRLREFLKKIYWKSILRVSLRIIQIKKNSHPHIAINFCFLSSGAKSQKKGEKIFMKVKIYIFTVRKLNFCFELDNGIWRGSVRSSNNQKRWKNFHWFKLWNNSRYTIWLNKKNSDNFSHSPTLRFCNCNQRINFIYVVMLVCFCSWVCANRIKKVFFCSSSADFESV